MKFEMSDIKSITLCDLHTRDKVMCDVTDRIEVKTNIETKVPVELMKQIDSQRLNCQLMGAGIIDLTLSFNCIIRAELNALLEESFTLTEASRYELGEYNGLQYSIECKHPIVTRTEYELGQPELESEALLLDFAEVFNEVPSLYSELFSQSQYPILIELI